MKKVRFRTLGCYPLTGGIESDAETLDEIIDETLSSVESERTTRVIDSDGGAASMEKRKRRENKWKKVLIILASVFALTGCSKASRVNWNIREDANNFKITRKVVALNTRTNDPLFAVEGKISLDSDEDGDLNVTIKTGKGKYKLFYAHLSNDVTYTCIQTKAKKENPYAYDIQFFPAKEVIENGVIDIKSSE